MIFGGLGLHPERIYASRIDIKRSNMYDRRIHLSRIRRWSCSLMGSAWIPHLRSKSGASSKGFGASRAARVNGSRERGMRVMPDLTLDLRYLKYAIHVAEAGSFRRAADRLSISQSTVSRRVQMLERQLGVSLFKRTRSGAGLTPEGERFLQQAAVGARYLREAATEMRSVRKLTTGLVRFGMLEAFPACPIIDLLATFRQRHPTIEVKLEEGTSEQNTLGVERGLLDAAISLGATKGHPFQIRRLCEPDLFVALSPIHQLASRPRLAWEDICDEVFLVRSDGAGRELAAILRRMLGAAEEAIQLSIQQVSRETLLTMVEQGFGLTITSVVHRPDIALVPLTPARAPTAAMISSSDNDNPALPLLLKCFDVLPAFTRSSAS